MRKSSTRNSKSEARTSKNEGRGSKNEGRGSQNETRLSRNETAASRSEAQVSKSKGRVSQGMSLAKKSRGSHNVRMSNSSADDEKKSSGSKRESSFVQIPKPQRYKSFIMEELPPCQVFRTRSSLDHLMNPIDHPKPPQKYNPPFRRNFRYFGYPQNLNLDINTPPRVKSWGSIPQIAPKSNKHKRRAPSSFGYRIKQDASFDPHWMGRLLKNNLLLENPGLIPATDQASISLGSTDKLKLIHPDFEVHNCPSELYFPITEKSRKAFCRINKAVQAKIDEQVRAYTVQNPTTMKFVAMEQVTLQDERERQSQDIEMPIGRRSTQQHRKSIFTVGEEKLTTSEEKLVYEHANQQLSPVIKTMCIEANWPGMNRQLYERPKESEEDKDVKEKKDDDDLKYGVARIPYFAMNVPDDLWQKLAKIRQRQQQMAKILQTKLEVADRNDKFQTFSQLELRDQVMTRAREDFMKRLKEDLNAPLPPELFQDNRHHHQPYHDFEGKGELPAQGPFWWKIRKESHPTQEELEVVEKSIQDAKLRHSFTHHLPGLLYSARHPFQPLELDWLEKGSEMGTRRDRRKTPSQIQEMPGYMMELDKDKFQEKFVNAVKEGAKDLVGPEVYELYKRTFGIVEKNVVAEPRGSTEKVLVEPKPVQRVRRRRRRRTSSLAKTKPKRATNEEDEEEHDEEEFEEEDEEDEEEGEEENEEELETRPRLSSFDEDPQYKVSLIDLLEDEQFPLPDIRFSTIDFPQDPKIPAGLKDDLKYYKGDIEKGEPVRRDEEEPKGSDNSDTPTDTDEEKTEVVPKFSHDPVQHLQEMYQDAVITRHKSDHRPVKGTEMEPPKLKDIFLMESYTEDIKHLLHQNDNIPKYLQLF